MIFFFFKMDEAWPNAPNLETDAWYLEILFLFFFFFFFFWKWMRHGWMPLVCKLVHDFWKPWYLRKRWFLFLFFKMNESWSNAPSLEIDAWFLEIFIFSLKRWWWWSFFFFFLKMNEAWPNSPSSTINVNFEKSYCVGTFNKAKFE